jgi:hypothetical protein
MPETQPVRAFAALVIAFAIQLAIEIIDWRLTYRASTFSPAAKGLIARHCYGDRHCRRAEGVNSFSNMGALQHFGTTDRLGLACIN